MTHGDDLIQILKLKSALAERDKLIDEMVEASKIIIRYFDITFPPDADGNRNEEEPKAVDRILNILDRAEAMIGGMG